MGQTEQNASVVEAIENLDPGLWPCNALAMLWYTLLALQHA